MKVLQVNCVYKKGSTGKIVYEIHKGLLQNNIESVVCYGRGRKTKEPGVYKTSNELYAKINNLLSRFTGIMYGGCMLSTLRLISVIKKENPDVVHLHCLNGYFVNIYKLVSWLNKNKINTVLTLHAEFMHTGNCSHALDCEKWKIGCGRCPRLKAETKSLFFDRTHKSWVKMQKAFEGFDNLVVASVSPWLTERAKQSPILANKKHCVVLNGLDTGIFKYYDTFELRKKYAPNGEKIVFYVTPSFNLSPNHIKGGYYFNELAKLNVTHNIKFLVVGSYKEDIKVPDNVVLLGRVSDQTELAKLYSLADVTVLTSKKETFSMVTAESLCCGTPVVGFKAGAPEQIAIEGISKFVEYGNINELLTSLEKFLSAHVDKQDISEKGKEKYSKELMAKNYMDIYKRMMEEL